METAAAKKPAALEVTDRAFGHMKRLIEKEGKAGAARGSKPQRLPGRAGYGTQVACCESRPREAAGRVRPMEQEAVDEEQRDPQAGCAG